MLILDSTMNFHINNWLAAALLMTLTYALTPQNEVVKTETSFSCEGRPSGYYADIETGCQVYHMCDGLGRQFSYSCPNTTLFQQRMLICDHWYMVNCSHSELDYDANLLIGQKDKPFVDDSDHTYHRTPRPDLVNHPYPLDYSDRRPKAQKLTNKNNLVGVETDNNGNSDDERQYFLPSHWSTEFSKLPKIATTENPKLFKNKFNAVKDSIKTTSNVPSKVIIPPIKPVIQNRNIEKPKYKASTKVPLVPNYTNTLPKYTNNNQNYNTKQVTTGLLTELAPPHFNYSTYNTNYNKNDEVKINQTFNVNRNISQSNGIKPQTVSSNQVPQSTITTKFNTISTPIIEITTKRPAEIRPVSQDFPVPTKFESNLPAIVPGNNEAPSIELLPPKLTYMKEIEISTSDPLTFYNIVPSKELEPPKGLDIDRSDKNIGTEKPVNNQSPRSITTEKSISDIEKIVGEAKIRDLRKVYFIPDYDFPLDMIARPGYDSFSSYQVNPAGDAKLKNISVPKRGDLNPDCPICDPEILVPGTCQPCVLIRR